MNTGWQLLLAAALLMIAGCGAPLSNPPLPEWTPQPTSPHDGIEDGDPVFGKPSVFSTDEWEWNYEQSVHARWLWLQTKLGPGDTRLSVGRTWNVSLEAPQPYVFGYFTNVGFAYAGGPMFGFMQLPTLENARNISKESARGSDASANESTARTSFYEWTEGSVFASYKTNVSLFWGFAIPTGSEPRIDFDLRANRTDVEVIKQAGVEVLWLEPAVFEPVQSDEGYRFRASLTLHEEMLIRTMTASNHYENMNPVWPEDVWVDPRSAEVEAGGRNWTFLREDRVCLRQYYDGRPPDVCPPRNFYNSDDWGFDVPTFRNPTFLGGPGNVTIDLLFDTDDHVALPPIIGLPVPW